MLPTGCCRKRFPTGYIPGLVLAGFQHQHTLQTERTLMTAGGTFVLPWGYFCIATFSCHWAPNKVATRFQRAPTAKLWESVFKHVSMI